MRWLEPAHPITDHPTPGRTEARRLACQDRSSASTRLVLYAVAGGRSHFVVAKRSFDKAIHKQSTLRAQTRDPVSTSLDLFTSTCSFPAQSFPPARPHASFMGRTAPSVLRPRRRRDGRLHGARQEESEHTRNPCPPSASRVVNYPTLSIEIGQISVLKSIVSVKTAAAALMGNTNALQTLDGIAIR